MSSTLGMEAMSEDICPGCGSQAPSQLWGSYCSCGKQRVHQMACTRCGRLCGQLTDDDYCGPEVMFCPDCLDKVRKP